MEQSPVQETVGSCDKRTQDDTRFRQCRNDMVGRRYDFSNSELILMLFRFFLFFYDGLTSIYHRHWLYGYAGQSDP